MSVTKHPRLLTFILSACAIFHTNTLLASSLPSDALPSDHESPVKADVFDYQQDSSSDKETNNLALFGSGPETDLWKRIEQGMTLGDHETRRRVQTQIKWYATHPEYLDRVAVRAEPFLHLIMEEIDKRNMPAEIALLPIVESAFQPFAYSHGRASGIWQFIPSTGRMYGLKQNWWYDGRRDIVPSTHAALKYLQSSHKRLNNDWLLALAAYNSGEGNVRSAIRRNKKKGRPTDFWNLDLPDETRAYVPKLLAISAIIADPLKYNITLSPISNKPSVVEVEVDGQIDLALLAQAADISLEKVYQLNPAYNRWATEPNKNRKLLIPAEKKAHFLTAMAKIPKKDRIQWKRHKIKSGQTLSHIARRYGTTTKLLEQINRVKSRSIRAGSYLMIPVATRSLNQYSMSKQGRSKSRLNKNRAGHKLIITVRQGDTFWDLSRKYGVSVRQLAKWNGLAPRDTLSPGKKLVLWVSSKTKNLSSFHRVNSRPAASTIRTIHYRVRQGDSLARISVKFRVTIAQLRKWNRLKKGKYLQPGQRLKMYVDVTSQT